MIRRPPRSTLDRSSAASDVYKRQLSYRYRSGKCSRELITRVPPPLGRLRSTIGAVSAHEYCVDIGNSRLVCCGASFFPTTSVLWNSLPSSVFPTEFNPLTLKPALICVICSRG